MLDEGGDSVLMVLIVLLVFDGTCIGILCSL